MRFPSITSDHEPTEVKWPAVSFANGMAKDIAKSRKKKKKKMDADGDYDGSTSKEY